MTLLWALWAELVPELRKGAVRLAGIVGAARHRQAGHAAMRCGLPG
jgi:hypothetical protein